MKKLLIIISFITVSSLSYAQNFGIKAGPTLASAYGSDVSDIGMKTAFHLGAYGVFGDTRDGRTLTVEFLLNQKGYQDSYSETTTSGFSVSTYSITNKVKLNYMDMNAVGNFMVGDLISINAGLGLNLYVGGEVEVEMEQNGVKTTITNSSDLGVRGIDFSSNLGVGFHVTEEVTVEARHYLGLLSLDEDNNYDIFSQGIMISVGYKISGR